MVGVVGVVRVVGVVALPVGELTIHRAHVVIHERMVEGPVDLPEPEKGEQRERQDPHRGGLTRNYVGRSRHL